MAVTPKSQLLAQILRAPTDPYYADFGRFITAFARTEGVVRWLLQKELEFNPNDTAALFHKLMLTDLLATISRLFAARDKADTAALVQEPFAQLRAIAEIRNALVHWRGTFDEVAGLVVNNTHRAHLPDKVVEYRVSRDQLNQMHADLIKIDMHLMTIIDGKYVSDEIHERIVQPVLDSAWLYIRPGQEPPGKGSGLPPLQ